MSLALLPIVDALDRAKRVPRGVIVLGIYLLLAVGATLGAIVACA